MSQCAKDVGVGAGVEDIHLETQREAIQAKDEEIKRLQKVVEAQSGEIQYQQTRNQSLQQQIHDLLANNRTIINDIRETLHHG